MLKSFQNTIQDRKRLPLLLRSLGIDYKQETIVRPNGLAFHQIFYCVNGSIDLTILSRRYSVHTGDMFLIRSRDGHRYQPADPNQTPLLNFIGFEGSISESLMTGAGLTESGVYMISDTTPFFRSQQELLELSERRIKQKKNEYAKILFSMLLDLSSCITFSHGNLLIEKYQFIENAITFMEEHYWENISVSDIASACSRTPEHLCTTFKKETGQTVSHFLCAYRINQARILLRQSPEMTVKEIGLACGFLSPSYFGAVFKKICGMTPIEYRLSH